MSAHRSPSSRAIADALRECGVAEAQVDRMLAILRATLGGVRIYVPQLPAAERERVVIKRLDRYRG